MLLRSLWGVDSSEWESYFPTLESQNITGIEASLSDIGFEQDHGQRFLRLVGQNGLRYILGLYTCWTDYYGEPEKAISVPVLLQRLETQLEQALSLDPRPVHLNCHAGLDDMALEDSIEFFRQANALTQRMLAGTGIGLSYETHRGRILYSPWIALQLLKSVEIEFTLDLSHWIVVLERQPILARTRHIHARMGTTQQSQVSNPERMDQRTRAFYHAVWQNVLDQHRSQGWRSTLCIEYGPWQDGYQPLSSLGSGQWQPEMPLDVLIRREAARLSSVLRIG
ncbi:hypothetical protein HDV03_004906 [Kappamyces sp. JEL0829]|nr:hypothetical protein HDV03_004906 [Kappamyces sp. JEL0829]